MNCLDEINNIVIGYKITRENLNTTASARFMRLFDAFLVEWRTDGIMTSYLEYMIASMKNATYRNVLGIILMGLCVKWGRDVEEVADEIYADTAEDLQQQGFDELGEGNRRDKTEITDEVIENMSAVVFLGIGFGEYIAVIEQVLHHEVMAGIMRGLMGAKGYDGKALDPVFKKAESRMLRAENGKYSGMIVDVARAVGNQAYLLPSLDDAKVRFIAEVDDHTTEMCRSLDGQVFYVHRLNTYQRYSDLDKKNVVYNTMGLKVGDNLPPIDNHFHWCRSTITYRWDDDEIIEFIRRSMSRRFANS